MYNNGQRRQYWRPARVSRFFGLDVKANILDLKDGMSPDLLNVYQNQRGTLSKRKGSNMMFNFDLGNVAIDEVGSCTLGSTKYYFAFAGGKFYYATSLSGAVTTISPGPAISTANQIWWAVLNNKLFFVDGTNNLRYFDGSVISDSTIYVRPTVALTSSSGAGTFTYVYTVDNGLGESPVVSTLLVSIVSAATVRVTGNVGPQTLKSGDVVRIYSRADTIAAASKTVATYTWQPADVTAGFKDIATTAIDDTLPQLYSELGVAVNFSAPTAMQGITVHYGRLVGWSGSKVYNSKVTNPHSWPSDSAQHEAFVYGVYQGDGESISVCVSFLEHLVVMKPSNIAIFGGIGPDDTGNNAYSFRRVEANGNGCIAGKSAVVVGDQETIQLVYLARNGYYATNGNAPARVGQQIEPLVQGYSDAIKANTVAFHHKREGLYVSIIGPSNSRVWFILDVRKDEGVITGWFKWAGIPAKCAHWDEANQYVYGSYSGYCGYEANFGAAGDYADVTVEYPSAFSNVTDKITVSGTYVTGDQVIFRSTAFVPGGLAANTTYYAISISPTSIQVATSLANALAGIAVHLLDSGTGTISLVRFVAIDGYYTTNWMHFGLSSVVKKLQKPAFLINSSGSSVVNISLSCAYDWIDGFTDLQTIAISPTELSLAKATPKNLAISRRKVRSIRYKFENNVIFQDINLQGLEQFYMLLRNRGNFA